MTKWLTPEPPYAQIAKNPPNDSHMATMHQFISPVFQISGKTNRINKYKIHSVCVDLEVVVDQCGRVKHYIATTYQKGLEITNNCHTTQ